MTYIPTPFGYRNYLLCVTFIPRWEYDVKWCKTCLLRDWRQARSATNAWRRDSVAMTSHTITTVGPLKTQAYLDYDGTVSAAKLKCDQIWTYILDLVWFSEKQNLQELRSNGGDGTHLTQDKDRSRILMMSGVKKWRRFPSAKRPRVSHKEFFSMDFASRKCFNVHDQVTKFPSFGERPRTGLEKRNTVRS